MAEGVKKLRWWQWLGIGLVFGALWYAYGFFEQKTLLESGRVNADIVIEQIEEGDYQQVKQQLLDFAGFDVEQSEKVSDLRVALINVDYAYSIIGNGSESRFVGETLVDSGSDSKYRGVYEIPSEQGGSDYLVVVLKRIDGDWQLANIILSATNPMDD